VGRSSIARYLVVAGVCAAVLLAGVPAAAQAAQGRDSVQATLGLITDVGAVPTGAVTHPVAAGASLHLTVTLRPSDPSGLSALLGELSTPTSPHYRQFLTESEFEARFSPALSTDGAVESYFGAYGGHGFVATSDRFAVSFAIPAAGASRALGVSFDSYSSAGVSAFTAVGTPVLPASLGSTVASISGLSGSAGPHTAAELLSASPPRLVDPSPGSWVTDGAGAGEPWFLGSDYTSAYHVSDLFPPTATVENATFPNRTAIATILMSGYNSTNNTDLPPYDPVVVQSYFNDTFPADWPHPNVSGVPVNVSDVTPPLPGYFNNSNDSTANSVENSLDLEMAGSSAPGATIVNFYFAGSLFSSSSATVSIGAIADDFAQCLAAALTHNYSGARLAVVSGSFGLTDLNDTLWNSELAQAAATGVTVVAASGDEADAPSDLTGRFQGQWPTWPASAAFNTSGVVSVGGTTVTLDGSATQVVGSNYTLNATFDSSVTEILQQSVWFDTLGGYGNVSGSEGGISVVYPEPWWQYHSAAQPAIVNATLIQGFGSLGRAEPDVAFPANTTVAYVSRNASGIYYEVVEGTSIAAPFFAGMLATWSAVSGHLYGFIDPELYRMASFFAVESTATGPPPPSIPSTPYLDVVQGSNYLFTAAPGWNAPTGWGGLDAVLFLSTSANASIANYMYDGPTPGLPPPLSVGAGTFLQYVVLFVGIAVATVIVVAVTIGTRRPTMPPPTVYPSGGPMAPWPPGAMTAGALPPPAPGLAPSYAPPPPMTFLCPYCGAPRPAEPTRCPTCGRL
jgi:subtilase family serine protease